MGRKKSKRGRHRSEPYPAVGQIFQNGHQSSSNKAVIENNLPGSSHCKSTGELRLKISKCTVQCTDIAKSGFCIQNKYQSIEEGKRSTDVGTSDVCLRNGCKSAEEGKQSSSPLKLKIPKSVIQPNEIKVPELRRTSRRIILRVRKDFYSDIPTNKRKKKCFSETKNGRDSSLKNEAVEASALNEKEKPRRRGRPKKISSDLQPNQHEKKPSSLDISSERASGQGTASKMNKSVWTLVPKEIFDSHCLKTHLVKLPYPNNKRCKHIPLSISSPVVVPSISSRKKKKVPIKVRKIPLKVQPLLKFPPMLKIPPNFQPQNRFSESNRSTRPTVIYFSNEKNNRQYSANDEAYEQLEAINNKQTQDMKYLRKKYHVLNEATLNYIYGMSGADLKNTDLLLTDMFSGKQVILPGNASVSSPALSIALSRIPKEIPTNVQECSNLNGSGNKSIPKVSEENPFYDDVDTLNRKLIVESIRMLYDEEAVLSLSY